MVIHWAWLIPTFIAGSFLGSLTGNKTSRGFGLGIIATLLALIGLS